MDYKEEYHNALERAKKGLPIDEVFPELKASEDERIIDDAIQIIRASRQRCAEYGAEADKHLKAISYLEKQKEKPKTADSIPSDCTSDVKCENRWHKVGDSLPDNGRLVLANDCLGNTLLARYDGEGNWEVSVYDNEDYYCRNTITKWCEIPSEKQKEQKSEVKYVYPKFRIGDEIVEICPNGSCSPVVVKYIGDGGYSCESKDKKRHLSFPIKLEDNYKLAEQKPAGWSEEDELMRTTVIQTLEKFGGRGTTGMQINWLNSLPKRFELQPKQEWSEEDKYKVDDICKLIEHATIIPRSGDDDTGIPPTRLHDKYKGELKAFIKSFRNCPKTSDTWKPSEEQMNSLWTCLHVTFPNKSVMGVLESLYNDLKKL